MRTRSSALLALVCAVTCAAALPAQRTWIVDQAGGPGHDFRSLAPAVAAAAAGDVIRIRAGAYAGVAVDVERGLHLIGEGPVTLRAGSLFAPALRVHDLPQQHVFTLSNVELDGLTSGALLRFERCAGLVTLQGVTTPLGSRVRLLVAEDCRRLHADRLFAADNPGGVSVSRSDVVLTGCALEGADGGPLIVSDATVHVDGSVVQCRGGVFLSAPAIAVHGGELRLTRSTVRVGSSFSPPFPAIRTRGGTVVVDPTTTLVPQTGAPDIDGTARVVRTPTSALQAATSGARLTTDVLGPAGAGYVTLLSFPSAPIRFAFGDLWVDAEHNLFVHHGTLASGRTAAFGLDHAPVPNGVTIVLQTATFAAAFQLSNPVAVVFP